MNPDASAPAAGHPLSLLMFGTLILAAILAAVLLTWFLRKRGNRHPMEDQRERNIESIRDEATVASRDGF